MATGTALVHKEGNITVTERIARAAVAIIMLTYPMAAEVSSLDVLALLPLIAIYPMFTAIVGWDPIQFVMDTGALNGKTVLSNLVSRIVLISVGTMMILVTLTISETYVGWYGLLALLAIVPVMIAIMGENPVQALRKSHTVIHANDKDHVEQLIAGEADSGMVKNAVEYLRDEVHKKAA
ncbi:YgaP-like transmembrane domain [Kaarinaea lacus]